MKFVKICMGVTCQNRFAQDLVKIASNELQGNDEIRLEKTACMGQCEDAPNVMFLKHGGPLSMVMPEGKVERKIKLSTFKKKLQEFKIS